MEKYDLSIQKCVGTQWHETSLLKDSLLQDAIMICVRQSIADPNTKYCVKDMADKKQVFETCTYEPTSKIDSFEKMLRGIIKAEAEKERVGFDTGQGKLHDFILSVMKEACLLHNNELVQAFRGLDRQIKDSMADAHYISKWLEEVRPLLK